MVNRVTDEQLLLTETKLSPLLVVNLVELPPPRIETQEPPPDTDADSVCPERQASTSDRVSPGFISPEYDVAYAPRANLSRTVDGYEARSGLGVETGVGDAVGVDVGVAVGDGVDVGFTVGVGDAGV